MAVNKNDKYYTPDWLCEHTIKKAIEIIGLENITEVVEPSAGDLAFGKYIKQYFPNVIHRFYDLYPEHPEVIKEDYKKVRLSYKKGRLTIGNPPFGTSSSLWKAFCKKAATNSDYIVFISPASQYNSNYYFKEGELVYSELLNDVEYRGSEVEKGKNQKVRTCLNIYKVYDREGSEDYRYRRLEQDVLFSVLEKRKYYTDSSLGFLNIDHHEFVLGDHGKYGLYEYNENDILIDQFYEKGKIISYNELHKSSNYCIRCKNKEVKDKVLNVLNNNSYKEFVKEQYEKLIYRIDGNDFKDYLIKHLYPTRQERLEQDVLIDLPSEQQSNDNFFDFYIARYMREKGVVFERYVKFYDCYGIKILNEYKRDEIISLLKKVRELILSNQIPVCSALTKYVLKDYLIKHLYPTREERLEQDIIIKEVRRSGKNLDFKCDFYMCAWGAGGLGKIYKELQYENQIGIKILNENLREKIEEFFKSYREKHYLTGLQNKNSGEVYLNYTYMNNKLMEFLYHEDLYEDFPDIKKPIHIERAIYAKELF